MSKILRFSTALGDYNKRAIVPNPIFKEIVTYVQVCWVFRDVHFRRFGDLKTRFVHIESLSQPKIIINNFEIEKIYNVILCVKMKHFIFPW
jgi:hypothetical protein